MRRRAAVWRASSYERSLWRAVALLVVFVLLMSILPGCVTVTGETTPPGASLYLNGQFLGTSPITRDFGFMEASGGVVAAVLPGHKLDECPTLPPKPPQVVLTSAPPGALVYINGDCIGATPCYSPPVVIPNRISCTWPPEVLKKDAAAARGSTAQPARPFTLDHPKQGSKGIYALEPAIDFNVLDSVTYDAATRQLTLIGHRDNRYPHRPIPYLQYLASLLDDQRPEFTLKWTPESEKRVDELLAHFQREEAEFSPQARRDMVGQLTHLFDEKGNVTPTGKLLLPALGVTPTLNGKAPGFLGADVKNLGETGLQAVSITPDSPAARAGLQTGDIIWYLDDLECFDVGIFNRDVRRQGAGAHCRLSILRNNQGPRNIEVTLGAASGDPWTGMTRNQMAACIFRAAGNPQAGEVTSWVELYTSLQNSPAHMAALMRLVQLMDFRHTWDDYHARVNAGTMSKDQGIALTFRGMAEALDRVYNLPGAPATSSYDQALAQTGDRTAALDRALGTVDQMREAALRQAFDRVLHRPDGLQIPPAMLRQLLHVQPELAPETNNLDASSQLACLMEEADYIGKHLINYPDLRNYVPGYVTESAFRRARRHSARADAEHMWISIADVDVAQSADGKTLATRSATMQFNVRELAANGRDLPPADDDYGALLTSLYDNLARGYPALHELRECAKLATAAKWLRTRDPDLRLPSAGRVAWKMPATVPGVMYMYLYPAGSADQFDTTFVAMGGIRLVPFERETGPVTDPRIVDLRRDPFADSPELDLPRATARLVDVTPAASDVPPLGWVRHDSSANRTVVSVRLRGDLRDGPSDVQVVDQKQEQAKVLWNAGSLEEAARTYRQRIQDATNPREKASLQLLLAEVLRQQGQIDEAVSLLKEAVAVAPDSPVLLLILARNSAENGDFEAAIQYLKKYITIDPRNAPAASLLADLQNRRNAGTNQAGGGAAPSPIARQARDTFAHVQAMLGDYAAPNGAGSDERVKALFGSGFDNKPRSSVGQPLRFTLSTGRAIVVDPHVASTPGFKQLQAQQAASLEKLHELDQKHNDIKQEIAAAPTQPEREKLQAQLTRVDSDRAQETTTLKKVEDEMQNFSVAFPPEEPAKTEKLGGDSQKSSSSSPPSSASPQPDTAK